MVPEFDVKQIDNRLSSDTPAHIYTWLIVMCMVGYFVLRGGFHLSDVLKFGFVIGLIVLQSLTRYMPKVKDMKAFASGGIGALLIYNIAIDLLFIWFLPLYSPFILIIPTVMYITIYYRGIMSYFISLLSLTVVVIIVSLKGVKVDSESLRFFPYLAIILGAAYGGIIQRASTIEAEVRNEFNRVSQKVSQEQQQLSSLINSMADSVIAIDAKGVILFYNAGAINMIDTNISLIGKPLNEFFNFYNKAGEVDVLQLVSRRNSFTSRDIYLITRNKEKINLSFDINPIRSYYNKWQQEGYIMLLRDITKEKTLDQERDEFVSVTSHELRTPIAVAEANLSTALITPELKNLDGDAKKLLEESYNTIVDLSKLVNDLSLLTQAEKEGQVIGTEEVDTLELLQRTVHEFSKKAKAKHLVLHLTTTDVLPMLVTNKFYLSNIISAFISNALKYTTEGSVIVSANQSDDGGVIFSVRDTGMGIGQSDKSRIFEKFYRSEDYKIRQTGGTGLGLYIAHKLSGYIKGKIWFESRLGEGSTFYLQVPPVVRSGKVTKSESVDPKSVPAIEAQPAATEA